MEEYDKQLHQDLMAMGQARDEEERIEQRLLQLHFELYFIFCNAIIEATVSD